MLDPGADMEGCTDFNFLCEKIQNKHLALSKIAWDFFSHQCLPEHRLQRVSLLVNRLYPSSKSSPFLKLWIAQKLLEVLGMGTEKKRGIQNQGQLDGKGLSCLYNGSLSGQQCQYSIIIRSMGTKVGQTQAPNPDSATYQMCVSFNWLLPPSVPQFSHG